MSKVKDRVFSFSKEILKEPDRNRLMNLYNQLHKNSSTQSNIGYYGRKQYKQFLGYLNLNARKEEINMNLPGEISGLNDETYESFVYGHNFIRYINTQCLAPLIEILPAAYKMVDPYWEIDPKNSFNSEVIIVNDEFNKLIRSFQMSKPYKIIKNKLELFPAIKDIKEQDFINGFFGMRERIKKFGFNNCPEELFDIVMKINQNTHTSLFSSIIFSLLYINASLQCIDQIIFQKFTSDKLKSINENNISKIYNMSSNSLSQIYELLTTEPVLFCGDILYLDIPRQNDNIKDFCVIDKLEISFSQEYGEEFKIGLRGTDDNFSFYGNLLSNIKV